MSTSSQIPLLLLPATALPDEHTARCLAAALLRAPPGILAKRNVRVVALRAPALSASVFSHLVAAFAVAGGGQLHLDIGPAPRLDVLDFTPYADQVQDARVSSRNAGLSFGLRALCADGTPLRDIPESGISVLNDLNCLSNASRFSEPHTSISDLSCVFLSKALAKSSDWTLSLPTNTAIVADDFNSLLRLLAIECTSSTLGSPYANFRPCNDSLCMPVRTDASFGGNTCTWTEAANQNFDISLIGTERAQRDRYTTNSASRPLQVRDRNVGTVHTGTSSHQESLVAFTGCSRRNMSSQTSTSNRWSDEELASPHDENNFARHPRRFRKFDESTRQLDNADFAWQNVQSAHTYLTDTTANRMNLDLVVSLASKAVADFSASNPVLAGGRGVFTNHDPASFVGDLTVSSESDVELEGFSSLPRCHFLELLNPGAAVDSRKTPLALHAHYREFLLSRVRRLRVLDDRYVTTEERRCAIQIADTFFEKRHTHRDQLSSLMRLTMAREMDSQYFLSRKSLYTAASGCTGRDRASRVEICSPDTSANACETPVTISSSRHSCQRPESSPVSCPAPALHKRPREPSLTASSPSSPGPLNIYSSFFSGTTAYFTSSHRHHCMSPLKTLVPFPSSTLLHASTSTEHRPLCCQAMSGDTSYEANDIRLIGDLQITPRQTRSSHRATKRPALVLSPRESCNTTSVSCHIPAVSETISGKVKACLDNTTACTTAPDQGCCGGTRLNVESVSWPSLMHLKSSPFRTGSDFTGSREDAGACKMALESNQFEALERHRRGSLSVRAEFNPDRFVQDVYKTVIESAGPPVIDTLTQWHDRPRQFEYNPSVPDQLVYGTSNGNLVVLNQETREVIGACRNGGGAGHRVPGTLVSRECSSLEFPESVSTSMEDYGASMNRMRHSFDWMSVTNSETHQQGPLILGLSWLHNRPNMFLAGTDAGSVHLYNVDWMRSGFKGGCVQACDAFEGLTSIHVSSDDRHFVVSGYSRHVGLFDLETGTRLEDLHNCHDMHINVLKFSNHNPNVFVTSSFDRYVKKWDLRESRPGGGRRPLFERCSEQGNVMVCFSPDDEYLLVSAVDNEVRQYLASDGRLHHRFDIPQTKQVGNYTRSYYMNGRDYIITGSCKEDVVRVYNAQSGLLFRELEMDVKHSGLVYVQSLRANPHREYNMSVLLACEGRSQRDGATAFPCDTLANVDLMGRMSSIYPEIVTCH